MRLINLCAFYAVILMTPSLTFAGGQSVKVRMLTKSEMRNNSGSAPAVQQGKGAGTTRSQAVRDSNAYLTQIAESSLATRDNSRASAPKWGDSAFRK